MKSFLQAQETTFAQNKTLEMDLTQVSKGRGESGGNGEKRYISVVVAEG